MANLEINDKRKLKAIVEVRRAFDGHIEAFGTCLIEETVKAVDRALIEKFGENYETLFAKNEDFPELYRDAERAKYEVASDVFLTLLLCCREKSRIDQSEIIDSIRDELTAIEIMRNEDKAVNPL